MTDRMIIAGGLIAVAVLAVVAVAFEVPDIEDQVIADASDALDEAGVVRSSVDADGRVAVVQLHSDTDIADERIRSAIDSGFFADIMRVDIDRGGPMSAPAPTTSTTDAPSTTTTSAPDRVRPAELDIVVSDGAVSSLRGRVGSPADTSALVSVIGPPNNWNLAEDATTLALPPDVVQLIDLAAGAFDEGTVTFSDGRLVVVGQGADAEVIDALRDALTEGGAGFTTEFDITSDTDAVTDAIVEATQLTGITFASGTAQISADGKTVLDEVAAILLTDPGLVVTIAGHTDDVGDPDANLTLSLARADAVAEHLVTAGVDRDTLTTVGLGDTQPIADNSTNAGRAANRRIEFTVSRTGTQTP